MIPFDLLGPEIGFADLSRVWTLERPLIGSARFLHLLAYVVLLSARFLHLLACVVLLYGLGPAAILFCCDVVAWSYAAPNVITPLWNPSNVISCQLLWWTTVRTFAKEITWFRINLHFGQLSAEVAWRGRVERHFESTVGTRVAQHGCRLLVAVSFGSWHCVSPPNLTSR